MSTHESRDELIDRLAESFAERYRRGQRPSISEFAEQHPHLADDLREVISAMMLLEEAGPGDATIATATAKLWAKSPDRFGEFRIIREIARGGMGVVYEAEQESLGRRVALKVLPQSMVRNEKHRQRFRREAKSAAKLHHTNIVPVFAVGEQDDLHYYAMQFIHGQSLDEVLVELRRLADPPGSGECGDATAPPVGKGTGLATASVAHSLWTGRLQSAQVAADAEDSGLVAHSAGQITPSVAPRRPGRSRKRVASGGPHSGPRACAPGAAAVSIVPQAACKRETERCSLSQHSARPNDVSHCSPGPWPCWLVGRWCSREASSIRTARERSSTWKD